METVELDRCGRVTIPKSVRDRLHLRPGDELDVSVEDGEVRLRVSRPDLATTRRDREWHDDAFLDAGETTFGDE